MIRSEKTKLDVAFTHSRLPEPSELDSDEEDDEEEDEDFEFSTDIRSVLPKKRIVKMKILSDNKKLGGEVDVKCRLPWTWSWLQATVELRYPVSDYKLPCQQLMDGHFNVVKYQLDPSQGDFGKSAISLFLMDMAKQSISGDEFTSSPLPEIDHQPFFNWLESKKSNSSGAVRLANLAHLLKEFESEESEGSSLSEKIHKTIKNTLAGRVWALATNQPTFFRAAPILFPRKIMSIIPSKNDEPNVADRKEKLLVHLEEIAKAEPWKLGFSDIMFKETSFPGLESPHNAMQQAWFFPQLQTIQKNSLMLYDAFKFECRSRGHTYLTMEAMPQWFSFYLQNRNRTNRKSESENLESQSSLYDSVLFLVDHEVLKRQQSGQEERFHLMRYWRAEEGVVAGLEHLLTQPTWHLALDLSNEEFSRLHSDPAQMRAARAILTQPVVMVSGRGGTGKTEVISAVMSAAEILLEKEAESLNNSINTTLNNKTDNNDSFSSPDGELNDSSLGKGKDGGEVDSEGGVSNGAVLYCAPTGKAASVIRKRVGKKAFTIHQVLASYKLFRRGLSSEWKFATTKIVVVDECSMVSVELFQWLIKCLVEGSQVRKVVLVGDHLQLPSVDPGNFMKDLYDSLGKRSLVVELKTNHRSEGSLLFDNAIKISRQQIPEFSSTRGFRLITPNENLFSLPPSVREGAQKLEVGRTKPMDTVDLRRNRSRAKVLNQDNREMYWSLLRDYRTEYNIENDEKSQIISFTNSNCGTLNQFSCFVYNRHLMYIQERGRKPKQLFEISDKIMCTKNADVPVYEPVSEMAGRLVQPEPCQPLAFTDGVYVEPEGLQLQENTQRLMNGNLYKVRARVTNKVFNAAKKSGQGEAQPAVEGGQSAGDQPQQKESEYFVLDDMAGEIVRANVRGLLANCKISHAWALSIHKFQGSETDNIVYVLSGSLQETWQHVYTAVTRGKKTVVILGTYKELQAAVKKKPIPRQTDLKDKMEKLFGRISRQKKERGASGDQPASHVADLDQKLEQEGAGKQPTSLAVTICEKGQKETIRDQPLSLAPTTPSKLMANLTVRDNDDTSMFEDSPRFNEALKCLLDKEISYPTEKEDIFLAFGEKEKPVRPCDINTPEIFIKSRDRGQQEMVQKPSKRSESEVDEQVEEKLLECITPERRQSSTNIGCLNSIPVASPNKRRCDSEDTDRTVLLSTPPKLSRFNHQEGILESPQVSPMKMPSPVVGRWVDMRTRGQHQHRLPVDNSCQEGSPGRFKFTQRKLLGLSAAGGNSSSTKNTASGNSTAEGVGEGASKPPTSIKKQPEVTLQDLKWDSDDDMFNESLSSAQWPY